MADLQHKDLLHNRQHPPAVIGFTADPATYAPPSAEFLYYHTPTRTLWRSIGTNAGDTEAIAVSGLDELIDDRVAALLQEGANITLTYDDAGDTLTVAVNGVANPIELEDDGVSLSTAVKKLNFTNFTITEPVADEFVITAPAAIGSAPGYDIPGTPQAAYGDLDMGLGYSGDLYEDNAGTITWKDQAGSGFDVVATGTGLTWSDGVVFDGVNTLERAVFNTDATGFSVYVLADISDSKGGLLLNGDVSVAPNDGWSVGVGDTNHGSTGNNYRVLINSVAFSSPIAYTPAAGQIFSFIKKANQDNRAAVNAGSLATVSNDAVNTPIQGVFSIGGGTHTSGGGPVDRLLASGNKIKAVLIYAYDTEAAGEHAAIVAALGNPSDGSTPNKINYVSQDETLIPNKYFETSAGLYKPMYRKAVDLGNLLDTAAKDVPHGLVFADLEQDSIFVYGQAKVGTSVLPIPYSNPDPTNSIAISVENNNIRVRTGADRSTTPAVAYIEYAKVADTAIAL